MEGLQPFHPEALLLIAALNPAVIVVGFMMGQRADQWQKLIVAAFAAALVGAALVWIGAWLRVLPARGIGGEAGLFVLQMMFGLVWAMLGYVFRRKR
jgi:ABC-type nickel/cobalt efflux system permease component RcnA